MGRSLLLDTYILPFTLESPRDRKFETGFIGVCICRVAVCFELL